MQIAVVLVSANKARPEIIKTIKHHDLFSFTEKEKRNFFNTEFEKIKNEYLSTIRDTTNIDIYYRVTTV